jgi:hypothetical protein
MADIIVSSDVDTFMQSANQSAMRTNVGSGTIVTQNSNNVSITGGSITGITDLSVADGGTGSSTASGARTNLEVYGDAEVNAKLATKETAGGVELDGVAGRAITTTQFFSENTAKAFTVSFWVKPTVLTSSSIVPISFGASVGGSTNYGGLEFGWRTSGDITSGWNIRWQTGGIVAASYLSVSNINYNLLDTWHHLTLTSDGSNYDLYLNGELVDSETTAVYPYRSSNTNLRIGSKYTFTDTGYFDGNVGPVRIFNRALSAAEVADLYETGVVAVADRWGTVNGAEYTSDFSAGTDGAIATAGTVTGNIDSISDGSISKDDCLRYYANDSSAVHQITIGNNIFGTGAYNVSFDYYIPSTNTNLNGFSVLRTGGFVDFSTTRTTGAWTTFSGISFSGDNNGEIIIRTSKNGSTIYAGANLSTDDLVYIKNVKVDKAGAIADLPLNEGIGYQFHDRSSNHFDALASLTGVTHLVPKANGKVRVKAANASSAMYMLRADSILPENSIVSNVLSEQCYVDLTNSAQTLNDYRIRLNPSGSDLQIQRSDGSNHQTLGTVTAPSSLSDVDVQINYKQIAQ